MNDCGSLAPAGQSSLPPYPQPPLSAIAFSGTEGTDWHDEIYVVDAAAGASLVALTSCDGFGDGCFNDFPAWSLDGTKIATLRNLADGSRPVFVMKADGSNEHQLTPGSTRQFVPAWQPLGGA